MKKRLHFVTSLFLFLTAGICKAQPITIDPQTMCPPITPAWAFGHIVWEDSINYSFCLDGDYDYAGLALDYPEEGVTGATLMANGPYRVWKNRLKGPGFGVFEKPYNNTVTGETWDYPEFKGYYSEFRAVEVHSSQRPDLTIITPTPDLYLQLYKPQRAKHHSKSSDPVGPDADLAVLHLIPAIGTKFYFPAIEGPQGEKNHCKNQTVSGKVYVRFGSKGA